MAGRADAADCQSLVSVAKSGKGQDCQDGHDQEETYAHTNILVSSRVSVKPRARNPPDGA